MDAIEEIRKLKVLLDQGAITEEEFQRLKSDLLSGSLQSSSEDTVRGRENIGKPKKRNVLILFIITLLVISSALIVARYLDKKDIINLNLNILSGRKENVNSNDIDSLKMFNNIIYEKGEAVGKLVVVEFVKKSGPSGRVINVPDGKMWTPLFFEYNDFGDNYYVTIPKILNEQNKNSRIGRDYYSMYIYDDRATNTWWEKESGFYLPEKDDFVSIKFSIRNRKAISGRNAIYINGYEKDVKYLLYFFEESLQ